MAAEKPTPHPHSWRSQMFVMQSAHYYVAGRHSTMCGFVPVAGLLFHHAIEMAIKGRILDANLELSDAEATALLKNRYGHKLRKLWKALLDLHPVDTLKVLTPLVERLDEFEDVRYPDFGKQALITTVIGHEDESPVTSSSPDVDVIFICLEDMDVVLSRIWTTCGFDVELLRGWNFTGMGIKGHMGNPFAEVAYYQNNRHALYVPAYDCYLGPFQAHNPPEQNEPSKWNP